MNMTVNATVNFKEDLKRPFDEFSMQMSDDVFKGLRELIHRECGIKLAECKKEMLTGRLRKRLRSLGLDGYREYFEYLNTYDGQTNELRKMLDAVTTNKTEFFRDPDKFDFFAKQVLPNLHETVGKSKNEKLNIWSAGCSTGQEPYTIAMILADFFGLPDTGRFSILATDICCEVLEKASDAIYPEKDIVGIPHAILRKYFRRGNGSVEGYYRIAPELRKMVTIQRFNLMKKSFNFAPKMDIIFCRNVVIYFDKDFQEKLFRKFYESMVPGGYLFIGSAETLQGINKDFKYVAPSIYRKPGAETIIQENKDNGRNTDNQ